MKKIPLTKGLFTIVDDEHYDFLMEKKWCAKYNPADDVCYALTTRYIGNRKSKNVYLHRILMDAKPGEIVDHINGDRLDNRLANLRICTPAQNTCNQKKRSNNTSGYKGVYLRKDGKWCAGYQKDRKHHYIGSYATAEEAALAYDAKTREVFGEFAAPNFPL